MMDFSDSVCLVTVVSTELDSEFSTPISTGTGFLIHQDLGVSYVVTCAHVIRTKDDMHGSYKILVNDQAAITVAMGQDGQDIAILKVQELLKSIPLILSDSGVVGQKILIPGISNLIFKPLKGVLGERVYPLSHNGKKLVMAWDLIITPGEDHLCNGYSGSPVIDIDTGSVVAVASHKRDQGRKGTAISISTLKLVGENLLSFLFKSDISQTNESEATTQGGFKVIHLQRVLTRERESYEIKSCKLDILRMRHEETDDASKKFDLKKQTERLDEDLEKTVKKIEDLENKLENKSK